MLQQSFSTCRTCGGKLIKKDTKRKASQLLQPYYYKAYYYCSACKKIYHSDAFKVTNKVSHPEPFDRHPEQSEGAQGKLREGSHEILRFTQNDNDAYEVEIWTDGACVFNGTHNAKAAWAFVAGEYEESGKLKGKQTNNRAEAYAIYHALVWTAKQGNKHVCIYTDSQITIHGLNKPAEKVKENRDIFEAIAKVIVRNALIVRYEKVLGHAGDVNNERADKLANTRAGVLPQ